MPTVNPSESKKSYIKRCVPILIKEGKAPDQANAICHSMYKQSKKRKQSRGDLSEPEWDKDNDLGDFTFIP